MPGPPPQHLTPAQRERLMKAQRRIRVARVAWAKTVRELGISACARELGITPQSLASRLATVEHFAEEPLGE